jgi:hypothetical protein
LIDTCHRELSRAPGNPKAIFADEAQDLTPLQVALIRKWGRHTRYFVLAGDDDQTIYGFAEATPEALFYPPIPALANAF